MKPDRASIDIPVHPAADLWPLMDEEQFTKLAGSIASHGLQVPIVMADGAILDGRNRYLACKTVEVEPRFQEYDGALIPTAFVITMNAHRRHLSWAQTMKICAGCHEQYAKESEERKKQTQGRPKKKPDLNSDPVSQDTKEKNANSTNGKLAQDFGLTRHQVDQALTIKKAMEDGVLPADTFDKLEQRATTAAKEVAKVKAVKKARAVKPEPTTRDKVVKHLTAYLSEKKWGKEKAAAMAAAREWLL